ncbi:MAG: extracellular solute-binding protein [Anaerolineae bacterium]|nr:extracellular solute-binding protein [Anaerolineae bacterium]
MNRYVSLAMIGVLMLGMALTACTPGEESLSGTVVLWHAWKESEIAGLNEVIAAFQAANPDVTVEVLYTPFDDLRNKFETSAATGSGPTVLIGASDWGEPMYQANLIVGLDDMITDELQNSIIESAWGGVTAGDGTIVGLPQTLKGVVLFRNTQIIPEAATTWDEFAAAAAAATAGDVVGADLEYGFFFSAAHLTACGGELMTANGDPAFNNEAGVCWIELLQSFEDVGPAEYYTDNDVDLFKAGQAGYVIDGTWNTSGLAEAIGAENLAIDLWPTYNGSHLSGYVQTENIYLSVNAVDADRDASWAFMEFFVSEEAQAILANPSGAAHIPVVSSVAVTDPLMQGALDAFAAQGTPFPVIAEMGAYWGPMDTALQSVFYEGADPATALETAYESVTAGIADIRGE